MSYDWSNTLFEEYLDYVNSLYARSEREKYFDVEDKTFSASDVIRIYSKNLTIVEQGEVKNFFSELMPTILTQIYNGQIWLDDPDDPRYPYEQQKEARTLAFITFYDLFYDTITLLYRITDSIRDIVTTAGWDFPAYIQLGAQFQDLVKLINNWKAYWDKLDYGIGGFDKPKIDVMNRDYPWWQF